MKSKRLPGGRGLTLIHRGPYDQLGRSYAKILQHANERKFNLALPTCEIYVKGPGLIFKGNPKNYLTEIQLPFTKGESDFIFGTARTVFCQSKSVLQA